MYRVPCSCVGWVVRVCHACSPGRRGDAPIVHPTNCAPTLRHTATNTPRLPPPSRARLHHAPHRTPCAPHTHDHAPQEAIPTSLLKMSNDHMSRAVKMFSGILKYMGETSESITDIGRLEIAQKLLHQVGGMCVCARGREEGGELQGCVAGVNSKVAVLRAWRRLPLPWCGGAVCYGVHHHLPYAACPPPPPPALPLHRRA